MYGKVTSTNGLHIRVGELFMGFTQIFKPFWVCFKTVGHPQGPGGNAWVYWGIPINFFGGEFETQPYYN